MRREYNGIRRRFAGRAIHTKGMKLIELSLFSLVPKILGIKRLELATGKTTEGSLCVHDGFGLKGTDEEVELFVSDILTINRIGGTNSMDGTKGGRSKTKIIGISMIEQRWMSSISFSMASRSLPEGKAQEQE
jgi:hypothetical protein